MPALSPAADLSYDGEALEALSRLESTKVFFSKQVLSVFSFATFVGCRPDNKPSNSKLSQAGWLDVGMRRHRNVMASCITLPAGRGYHL